MKVEHPHTLADDDARARVQALGDYIRTRHGIDCTWSGDQATFRGKYLIVRIEGTLTLSPGLVVFEGKDPGMLWRSKAKDYLARKLGKYLDPKTPLEQLPRA